MPVANLLQPPPIDEVRAPLVHTNEAYLDMLNLFRIVACLAVVSQHSFIWTNMTGNVVGTGFITMLHLSRNSFFFLTGLVVCYSQLVHPRTRNDFWRRRYVQLGVPYLAWTFIYLVYSIIAVSASWDEVGRFLRHTLLLGYSQMYAVVVIFQFYLVFPYLLKAVRKIDRPWLVMTVSLAFATVLGFDLHYHSWFPAMTNVTSWMNRYLPWGRDILVYQEFFVAGMLVALHIDEVLEFVGRHYRALLAATAAVGGLMVACYGIQVDIGNSVERASDIYEPEAMVWCFAAIAGIFTLSFLWYRRTQDRHSVSTRLVTYGAAITGGVFFAHTLFLNLIRSAVGNLGLRDHMPWETTVVVFLLATIVVTAILVTVVLRTPLRWVLGGPDRVRQRAGYPPTQVELPSGSPSYLRMKELRPSGGLG